MTEDDTFNALRQKPFHELLKLWRWTGKGVTVHNIKHFLEENNTGWLWYEFVNHPDFGLF